MMNNRYLLCLLICCALFYFSVPRIHPFASGLEGLFAISWLAFAFLVFAGNLAALLYPYKYKKRYGEGEESAEKNKKRMRAN
ncbi:hypothetical protein D4T97_006260 [Siminovitchia acidinfaciens]|uniref:Uncharacterized protein n=2 Tax=Siminovitchia acidinfaciens TaxID=2321395 RepID=A0A429Y5B9_9BACI|nr:hypothetical protein D4T97_006260 [Siminovitchia acidinfaciens]